jgi:hypothetical protein
MKYMSSRGGETGLSFQQVLFAGYAKVQYSILQHCLSFQYWFFVLDHHGLEQCRVLLPLDLACLVNPRTAKTPNRKFETDIPRKGIARPQSQYLCVCDRFIYSHDRSAYSHARK